MTVAPVGASLHAVVLAAGKGTRMKSARAKVLHEACGVPLLEHVLRSVSAAGAAPITVVVGHQADTVEAAFAGRGFGFARQDPPRGTGHALLVARNAFAQAKTLLVVNGDLPLLRDETLAATVSAHRQSGAAATLLTLQLADPGAYGRVVRGPDGLVEAVVEARDASSEQLRLGEVNAGVYVFDVARLLPALDLLRPNNAQNEYYLTDVVSVLRRAGHSVAAHTAADPTEALGVNTLAELADLCQRLRQRRNETLMLAGVTIEDPATTFVGLDVVVEQDAVLRPFTFVQGRSVVRAGAVVGPFVRVVDSEIGTNATILDHCLVRESRVGEGASIGPFAQLRPECVVEAGAKVGNFVELKKTRLGAGAKAPHLSYLGDATIAPKVNVGAGTITCNYDGAVKHPTHIEHDAFIGSNATLVAPLTIGAGAYVAAGSVITEDVPPQALALGRARQVAKLGWAETRRPRKTPK